MTTAISSTSYAEVDVVHCASLSIYSLWTIPWRSLRTVRAVLGVRDGVYWPPLSGKVEGVIHLTSSLNWSIINSWLRAAAGAPSNFAATISRICFVFLRLNVHPSDVMVKKKPPIGYRLLMVACRSRKIGSGPNIACYGDNGDRVVKG